MLQTGYRLCPKLPVFGGTIWSDTGAIILLPKKVFSAEKRKKHHCKSNTSSVTLRILKKSNGRAKRTFFFFFSHYISEFIRKHNAGHAKSPCTLRAINDSRRRTIAERELACTRRPVFPATGHRVNRTRETGAEVL